MGEGQPWLIPSYPILSSQKVIMQCCSGQGCPFGDCCC